MILLLQGSRGESITFWACSTHRSWYGEDSHYLLSMRYSLPPYSRKPMAAEMDTRAMKAEDMTLSSDSVALLCARPVKIHSTASTA